MNALRGILLKVKTTSKLTARKRINYRFALRRVVCPGV